MRSVALLVPYRHGVAGPEFFLQLGDGRLGWRLWGGAIEPHETPREAVLREASEELSWRIPQDRLGVGHSVAELLTLLPLASKSHVFPVVVGPGFPGPDIEIREGRGGGFFPIAELPPLSLVDRWLLHALALRLCALDQPALVLERSLPPAFSVDLEFPYHWNVGGRTRFHAFAGRTSDLPKVIERLLADLQEMNGIRGTFFVVESVARAHPDLVRAIAGQGHEIGCHGRDHELVPLLPSRRFCELARASRELLEELCATRVRGFRAPSWSCPRDPDSRGRFYRSLRRAGYEYSSSVLPAPGFGPLDTPSVPHRCPADIMELPVPVLGGMADLSPTPVRTRRLGIPYSGGLPLRLWGVGLAGRAVRHHLLQLGYCVLYSHPRELLTRNEAQALHHDQLQLAAPERWLFRLRTDRSRRDLLRLLRQYGGCRMQDYLEAMPGVATNAGRGHETA